MEDRRRRRIRTTGVLIAGGRPVGPSAAAGLRRPGVRCRLVDRLPARLPYARAVGIVPRTPEIRDRTGLALTAVERRRCAARSAELRHWPGTGTDRPWAAARGAVRVRLDAAVRDRAHPPGVRRRAGRAR
ncbi:FAD-dependent monooxygenase [Streptomyces sp. NPDC006649]|uniref:FAD-dependent monooxygenase n=1 Tax=Streptomyces sp. NPDC006649 TaxID=3156896 RepID=UPI00339F6F78